MSEDAVDVMFPPLAKHFLSPRQTTGPGQFQATVAGLI